MNYKHLTENERYQIYALMEAGHNRIEVARILNRSPSTINRELKRILKMGSICLPILRIRVIHNGNRG